MIFSVWKLGRKIDRIQETVDQIHREVSDIKQDDMLMAQVRADQDDLERRLSFLETQAGVMDPGGITAEEAPR